MIAVVVPTCRPESLASFVEAWTPQFEQHNVELVVVEDRAETWANLPDFIPRRTGSIRSWGFLRAWREGWDVITLDDDCLPAPDVDLIAEYERGFAAKFPVGDYFDVGQTFGLGEFMRGYPFDQREAAYPLLQYGGWDNVPDMDAVTQAAHEEYGAVKGYRFDRKAQAVPAGIAFTGCIMNVAIRHEAIPMMYQLVMGLDRVGYDRWDDIWSGLFAKRICDHLEIPIVVNGKASVVHSRASDTASNYTKEKGGYDLNEKMWGHLANEVSLWSGSIIDCYLDLWAALEPDWFGPHGQKILDGMSGWLGALNG